MAKVGRGIHGPRARRRGGPHVDPLVARARRQAPSHHPREVDRVPLVTVPIEGEERGRRAHLGARRLGERAIHCAQIPQLDSSSVRPRRADGGLLRHEAQPVHRALVLHRAMLHQRLLVDLVVVVVHVVVVVVVLHAAELGEPHAQQLVVGGLRGLRARHECRSERRLGARIPELVRHDGEREARPVSMERVHHVIRARVEVELLARLQGVHARAPDLRRASVGVIGVAIRQALRREARWASITRIGEHGAILVVVVVVRRQHLLLLLELVLGLVLKVQVVHQLQWWLSRLAFDLHGRPGSILAPLFLLHGRSRRAPRPRSRAQGWLRGRQFVVVVAELFIVHQEYAARH